MNTSEILIRQSLPTLALNLPKHAACSQPVLSIDEGGPLRHRPKPQGKALYHEEDRRKRGDHGERESALNGNSRWRTLRQDPVLSVSKDQDNLFQQAHAVT